MAVPDFQSLMLPVLRALTDGSATPVAEVCARVAAAEGLTPDDLLERTRGGHTTCPFYLLHRPCQRRLGFPERASN